MTFSASSNFNHGYPTPGPQSPSGQKVMDHVFFVSETEWKKVREEMQFDYIIIGSGFCAYAFAERILKHDPHKNILIIERGGFFLPEHFQNLPLPYQKTLGGLSETFPWTLSEKTHNAKYIRWQHGIVPFFGGRSTLWSAWCPQPSDAEMAGWPDITKQAVHKNFDSAKKLLNVVSANEIDSHQKNNHFFNIPTCGNDPIYGIMQKSLTAMLTKNYSSIPNVNRVEAAPLAAGSNDTDFSKYGIPGPLLTLAGKQVQLEHKNSNNQSLFRIVTNCIVHQILEQNGKATALETSRGVISLGNAKLILAMGTLPPTTLIHNSFPKESFPQLKNVGERFTAHFISSIVARIPRKCYPFNDRLGQLEMGAIYIAGNDPKNQGQFHIQLSILSDKYPVKNAQLAARYMPDVVATASPQQLATSEDYLVFVCAVLGEIDYKNSNNWFRKNSGADLTCNSNLQVLANENDYQVWDTMDEATFAMLEKALLPENSGYSVEYWHNDQDQGTWQAKRPSPGQIRVDGLVHEGSTLWIGNDHDSDGPSPVDINYKLRGIENVYVTGGCLWTRSGSWNPTAAMVALTQDLADKLSFN
ncbi:GMC oxidoreductase [Okeanomitos corallinicola TIOX110]|uniref:GMC oxidoreductase n=1 Tax=Okeanomitos corallinicola TIOX110 TaxID=3133117 RepID=A0ABZ2UPS9_9CYAN